MAKRALISVSDKTGLVDFAEVLIRHGYEIVSTGGTMKALVTQGLTVTSLSDVTGHPEILDGRVKTLHPAIFAGILARDTEEHLETIAKMGYKLFDLVCVNLYPFVKASRKAGIKDEELIEEIDIGGPSLLRAAAKNHARVAVVSDPADYADVTAGLEAHKGHLAADLKARLAIRTLYRTAAYDAQIAQTLAARAEQPVHDLRQVAFGYEHAYSLRYGENPHQTAAAFVDPLASHSLLEAAKLQGKALSYNNLLDTDAALRILLDTQGASCVIVKHNTPCGAATAGTLEQAYLQALASDPKSAFGGIVALSQPVDEALARRLSEIFLEVIVAPEFAPAARELLQSKKNVRLLELKDWRALQPSRIEARMILGGALVQTPDAAVHFEPKTVSARAPSAAEQKALMFGWTVCRGVKSNAIVLAKEGEGVIATVGISGGQTSRVDAVEMAIKKAGDRARGSVLASDAFFPFADNVELAQAAGVTAVIQPGGSVKDDEVIAAIDRFGMAMQLTGVRHFRH
jgi:phosphoribosylaminoimidazolecarboxamide formyltransferase / IMP cyclohydrolase